MVPVIVFGETVIVLPPETVTQSEVELEKLWFPLHLMATVLPETDVIVAPWGIRLCPGTPLHDSGPVSEMPISLSMLVGVLENVTEPVVMEPITPVAVVVAEIVWVPTVATVVGALRNGAFTSCPGTTPASDPRL